MGVKLISGPSALASSPVASPTSLETRSSVASLAHAVTRHRGTSHEARMRGVYPCWKNSSSGYLSSHRSRPGFCCYCRCLPGFFAPVPDAPARAEASVARAFGRWRASVFLSITIGYTVFYVTRLPMSVAKNPMIDGGVLTIGQAALLDTAFLWSYAFGK